MSVASVLGLCSFVGVVVPDVLVFFSGLGFGGWGGVSNVALAFAGSS